MAHKGKVAVVAAALVAAIGALEARDNAIKIATIAPENSAYTKALRQMAADTAKRTDGRVTYRVYPAGDDTEAAILRNMGPQFRRLQAAQLSAITLGNVESAFNVFGLPMFFESYAEADAVLAALEPELEKRLASHGLKPLNFAYVGWVHVFSKKPVRTVEDLKHLKLYTSAGDDRLAEWYKKNKFTAVVLDSTVIATQLRTDMLDAVPAPPAFAQILGWYESAPYMMDLAFAPLMGATVMSLDRWNQLAPADQAIVMEEAKRAGERLRKEIPAVEQAAIEAMQKRSLQVTKADAADWRRMAEQLGEAMRKDGIVPGDVYEIAKRERDAVRARR